MQRTSTRSQIPGLNGLRAVAATMVFLFHACWYSNLPVVKVAIPGFFSAGLGTVLLLASRGVSLFFVLSGFLLSLPFWRETLHNGRKVDLKDYFKRRFFRLYPAYLVAITIYALFRDVAHPLWIRLVLVFTHLLLVHNFAEATVYDLSPPLWAVATEFQLYILLPVLFLFIGLFVRRFEKPLFIFLAIFVFTGLLGLGFSSLSTYLLTNITIDPRLVKEGGHVIASSPLIALADFGSGVAFALLYVKLPSMSIPPFLRQNGLELIALLTVLTIMAIAIMGPPTISSYWPYWPGFPLLFGTLVFAVSLSRHPVGIAAFLELWPLRTLGMVSYSFYLFHDFVLWNVFNHFPSILQNTFLATNLFKAIIAYLLTFVVAWLSYVLIERRFIAYSHRSANLHPFTQSARP